MTQEMRQEAEAMLKKAVRALWAAGLKWEAFFVDELADAWLKGEMLPSPAAQGRIERILHERQARQTKRATRERQTMPVT